MTTKQALELYRRAGKTPPPDLGAHAAAEKVRNTRRKAVDGREFRSTLEARCYQLLSLWQKAGRISGLECQPKFLLQAARRDQYSGKIHRQIVYIADFRFVKDGRVYVIDAKGYRMPVYRIKRKLFAERFPDVVFEEWTCETLRKI